MKNNTNSSSCESYEETTSKTKLHNKFQLSEQIIEVGGSDSNLCLPVVIYEHLVEIGDLAAVGNHLKENEMYFRDLPLTLEYAAKVLRGMLDKERELEVAHVD